MGEPDKQWIVLGENQETQHGQAPERSERLQDKIPEDKFQWVVNTAVPQMDRILEETGGNPEIAKQQLNTWLGDQLQRMVNMGEIDNQ
jgi:hypothetical protein